METKSSTSVILMLLFLYNIMLTFYIIIMLKSMAIDNVQCHVLIGAGPGRMACTLGHG